MTAREVLDAIQARVDAATPGPWKAEPYQLGNNSDGRMRVTSPNDLGIYNTAEDVLPNDAEFIAHARTDIQALLVLARKQQAAIDAVRELHVMEFIEDGEFSRNRCAECLYEAEGREECPTIGAIEVTFERLEAKP